MVGAAAAADWPTFRHDNHRSGQTLEQLPAARLAARWVYRSPCPPQPAWAGPAKWDAYKNLTLRSMRNYDPVYHVTVCGSALYFGSSVDDSVHCINVADGREKWTFTTDGPVRIAPTCVGDNVYFGSDDGHAYCIRAADGGLVWKCAPADLSRRVLNNGRLIPLWPCRTGVLVADGKAYFATGMLPWKPSYLCAVDAETGHARGKDEYIREQFGMTMEGALLASKNHIFATQGRVPPLLFNRTDGTAVGSLPGGGGCFMLITDNDRVLHGPGNKTGWITDSNTQDRTQVASFPGANAMVVAGQVAYLLTDKTLSAVSRSTKETLWNVPCDCPLELILAGDTLFAGGRDAVAAFRCADGRQIWRAEVEGKAFGLAVAAGSLFVSTHEGTIHSFRPGESNKSARPTAPSAKPAVKEETDSKQPTGPKASEQPKKFTPSVGPYVQFAGPNTAIVRWQSAKPSPTVLEYGTSTLSSRIEDTEPKTDHVATLQDLRKDLTYYYVIRSKVDTEESVSKRYECDTFLNYRSGETDHARNTVDGDQAGSIYARAAEHILAATNIRKGICLIVGSGEGRLAVELARRSRLRVIGVDDDPKRVAAARAVLQKAKLYGSCATVHFVESLDSLPFVEAFADLVVSERFLAEGQPAGSASEMHRVLRPDGGTICLGIPGAAPTETARSRLEAWLAADGRKVEVTEAGGWLWGQVKRPPLSGSGVWTDQYGRADNSAYGGESLMGASNVNDLRVQWVGRPGPRAQTDRNGRKPSPLAVGGRLFMQGLERVIAISAYNGTILWSLEIPDFRRFNIPRDCGNWCADADNVFVAVRDRCWRIDAETGRVSNFFRVLPGTRTDWTYDWGYVGRIGNRLIGSAVKSGTSHTSFWGGGGWYDSKSGGATFKICSDRLFALDNESGEELWSHTGGLLINSTITMADGCIYFVECRNQKAIDLDSRRVGIPELWQDQFMVALNADSGQKIWEQPLDTADGNVVFYLACAQGKLVLVSSDWQYNVYAFDAATGGQLWERQVAWQSDNHGGHMSRPAIVGERVYVRPKVLSLLTGEVLPIVVPGGGCGTYAATDRTLLYRAGNVTMWSRDDNKPTSWARLRPGCWLSTIPACGMVLSPEAGGGCSCGNWLETSIAFMPSDHPAPQLSPDASHFLDEITVALDNRQKGGITRYTLDGSDPTAQSPRFRLPVKLNGTTTVKARTFWEKGRYGRPAHSDVLIGTFNRDYPGPIFEPDGMPFIGSPDINISRPGKTGLIRYTLDGADPTDSAPVFSRPIHLEKTMTIKARIFYEDGTESPITTAAYTKTEARAREAVEAVDLVAGLDCDAYEGDWEMLPDFDKLKPKKSTVLSRFRLDWRTRDDAFALRFRGFIRVPQEGIYNFYLASDDGSKLYIGEQEVVDNDGIHPVTEKSGWIALKAGLHPITVTFWDAVWDEALQVSYAGPGIARQAIPADVLFRKKQ